MSNLLTVGMATYSGPDNDEFAGVWHTVANVRGNGPPCDLIVVNTHPLGCKRTEACTLAAGGRYIHRPNLTGTSASRDSIFRSAATEWVLVCDDHVNFETNALQSLIDYAAAHPDSRDLIGGPLVYDDGTLSTHWRQTTPPGLWGVWSEMWVSPDYYGRHNIFFDLYPDSGSPGRGFAANNLNTIPPGFPAPTFDWSRKETELRDAGCKPACEQPDAFEIPMQGLGCWAMRKAAWPGFNPLFTGFGGEEGYVHQLVRRLGGKSLCLPSLRWRHRFRDTSKPVPYPLRLEDHAWNLLVGHRELGIDATAAIEKDFGGRMPQGVCRGMVGGVERCQAWDRPGVRPTPVRILGIWYSNNSAPLPLLQKSLACIDRAAKLTSEYGRAEVEIVTCPWESVPNNPFPETLAKYRDGPGHLNIVRQQRQAMIAGELAWTEPDVVCFLEHDVLYPPDYFERVAVAALQNPDSPVISNLDYEGLNATGWLAVRERHEPLHQLSVRWDYALVNLDRAEHEAARHGECELEPDPSNRRTGGGWVPGNPDRNRWARLPPRGVMPAVHVNHDGGRATSHGEVVFERASSRGTVHKFWGGAADWWPGSVTAGTGAKSGCGACGKGPGVQPKIYPTYADIGQMYESLRAVPSDFHEHMSTLRGLANGLGAVAEVSFWDEKPALVALAASTAKKVISVCGAGKTLWDRVRVHRPDLVTSSHDGPILRNDDGAGGVDLLYLDEHHRAEDVYRGLVRYAPHTSRYLVVHCTTDPYGETGDDGGPGVMPGVRRFLSENREWTAIRHDRNNHGLIVASKDGQDKKTPPGAIRRAMNFAKALAQHAAAGQQLVTDEVWQSRLDECVTCPMRTGDICSLCGCPVDKKTSWADQECPANPPRWAKSLL